MAPNTSIKNLRFQLKVLLLSFTLLMGCDNETAEQAYNRGYGDGYEIGYGNGYRNGHTKGYWKGYKFFIGETWKPTLAGITIIGIGMLGATAIMYFFVIPGYRNIRARGMANEMLTSTRGIKLLTKTEASMIRDLRNAEDIFEKTSLYLQRNLQSQLDEQDSCLRKKQNNELYETEIKIKNVRSDLTRIRAEIECIADRYHELRKNEAKSIIKQITLYSPIAPKDKIILLKKVKNSYNI
jgi:hypothetical protein